MDKEALQQDIYNIVEQHKKSFDSHVNIEYNKQYHEFQCIVDVYSDIISYVSSKLNKKLSVLDIAKADSYSFFDDTEYPAHLSELIANFKLGD